jgi:hypothetical protein
MIVAFIVGLVMAVGVLAVVSGADSRETHRSQEHLAAVKGMTWRADRDYDLGAGARAW